MSNNDLVQNLFNWKSAPSCGLCSYKNNRLGPLLQYYKFFRLKEPLKNVKKMVASKNHYMCLTENGEVFVWSCSQLVGGTLTRNSATPIPLTETLPSAVATLKGVRIVDIACGGSPQTGKFGTTIRSH